MKRVTAIATLLTAMVCLAAPAEAAPPESFRGQGSNANAYWFDEDSSSGAFVNLSVPTSDTDPVFVFVDWWSCAGETCTSFRGSTELSAGQYTIVTRGGEFSASIDATITFFEEECGPSGCQTVGGPFEKLVSIQWASTSGRLTVSSSTFHNVGPQGMFSGFDRMLARDTTATGMIDGTDLGSSQFASVGRSTFVSRFRMFVS